MRTNEPSERESTDTDPRDVRALEQYLTVLPDVGPAGDRDDLYLVVSQSGSEYLVDTRADYCTCPDHEYRNIECKHLRRVAFATGARPVPDGVDPDPQLGHHVDGDDRRQVLAADGGTRTVEPDGVDPSPDPERVRVPVAGGVLVYEPQGIGRELVGAECVDDWDALTDALTARGHNRGVAYQLPELDTDE